MAQRHLIETVIKIRFLIFFQTICQFVIQLFSRFSLPCQFHEFGCPTILSKGERLVHQLRCQNRLIQCSDLECAEEHPISKFKNHIETTHGYKVHYFKLGSFVSFAFSMIDVQLNDEPASMYWPPMIFCCFDNNQETLFSLEICRENGKWLLWVYVIGTQEEGEQFNCVISFVEISEKGKFNKKSFKLPIVSIDKSQHDVVDGGPMLTLSEELVLNDLVNPDGNLRFSCQILKKKSAYPRYASIPEIVISYIH